MTISFAEARQLYATAAMMKDDLPDGMWEELLDLKEQYKDSERSEGDQALFAEELTEIFNSWGFSSAVA